MNRQEDVRYSKSVLSESLEIDLDFKLGFPPSGAFKYKISFPDAEKEKYGHPEWFPSF